tara:strand:- start:1097 stop:2434 length:1338 start_codon:yes stop_codon:yes gene_type:complete
MKISLYLLSVVLALPGALIFIASFLDPDLDNATKTAVIFVSSLLLIPSFLIFKKNRGETISFSYARFVSLYAFSIIFALGALMIFVNGIRYNSDADAEAGIVYLIFSILFFWLKKKGQISSSSFAMRLQNLKNFKLKEFSDQDILDLIGKKITVNKKTQVNIPFKFELKLSGKFSAEADKYGFDLIKWNQEVKIENQKVRENEDKKRHYELLYVEYDKALQTYQLAQQTRKATLVNAGLQKKAGGAFLLTSGDKKPKEPTKPAYHKIRNLNKSDFLTKKEGIEKFNDQRISIKKEYAYFNFVNAESFMNIFDFKKYENIKKIINEILTLKNTPDFKKTIIDYKIKSDDIKILFNKNVSQKGNIKNDAKNEFETSIKNENDKDNLDLLYSLIDQKKFALKNVKFTKYNVDYRSTNVSYIPFLRIDYSDKGEKKVAILDYISRSIIY